VKGVELVRVIEFELARENECTLAPDAARDKVSTTHLCPLPAQVHVCKHQGMCLCVNGCV
jgi:hypothetical protein